MRVVAFDVGKRRTGVAVSDASGSLARPLRALEGGDVLEQALRIVEESDEDDDRVSAIVVGLPRRLDGSDTTLTPVARKFAEEIGARSGLPIILQDERLSSVEAESRLAVREKDWRARKAKLDAASAAIILQDYLDSRPQAGAGSVANDDEVGW